MSRINRAVFLIIGLAVILIIGLRLASTSRADGVLAPAATETINAINAAAGYVSFGNPADLFLKRNAAGELYIGSTSGGVDATINLKNVIVNGMHATSAAAPTIASATTIAPTASIVFVSGVTTIQTITPPSPISAGGGSITIIPTGVFLTGVTGNIALASTSVVSKALTMTYDVTTTKWYPSY